MGGNPFARAFQVLFGRRSSASFSDLKAEPESAEVVVRFQFLKKWRFADGRIKPLAFQVPKNQMELSVFRRVGIADDDVWQLARIHAKSPGRKERIHGAAEVSVDAVLKARLHARRDEPPPRHAVLVGWPADKEQMMQVANELARDAQPLTVPGGIPI